MDQRLYQICHIVPADIVIIVSMSFCVSTWNALLIWSFRHGHSNGQEPLAGVSPCLVVSMIVAFPPANGHSVPPGPVRCYQSLYALHVAHALCWQGLAMELLLSAVVNISQADRLL